MMQTLPIVFVKQKKPKEWARNKLNNWRRIFVHIQGVQTGA